MPGHAQQPSRPPVRQNEAKRRALQLVNLSRVQTAHDRLGQGIIMFRRYVTIKALYLAYVCAVIHVEFLLSHVLQVYGSRIPEYESDVTLSVSDICTIRLSSEQMFGDCLLGSDYIELSGRLKSVKMPKRYAVLLCTYLLFIGLQLQRHIHCIKYQRDHEKALDSGSWDHRDVEDQDPFELEYS